MSNAPPPRSSLKAGLLTTGSLPAEFMEDVGRRVSIAALAFAVVAAIVAVMSNVSVRIIAPDPRLHYAWNLFGGEVIAVLVGLAVLLAYWAPRLSDRPRLVLNLGIGFQLITAAAVALLSQWNPPFPGRGVSWVCIVILTYPAVVPARPLVTLAASLVAATFEPVVYVAAIAAGVITEPMPPFMAAWAFLPTYICAGLSVIPAHVVRQLGRQMSEARQLGNYELGERLGVGGMGEVYRASHRLLARPTAIKLIAPEMLGRDPAGQAMVLERFRREAWAAASLRSPHTIELYDFGVANDGTLYFAMELLEGIDLQQLVDEFGPQQPGRVIHILRQACLSLAEAHERGLVHRDIKPSNLMLCRMGPQVDFLKVLDFGLVKTDPPAAESQLTAPDVTAGTPAYLPPEALDGVATLDHRADLYALGCVAYWLLAGRPVFEGSSALQVLLKHGREVPAPMIGSLVPVPDDLEALVRQCLAKSPDDRPENALALERALGACASAGEWRVEDALEWWREYGPGAARAGGPGQRLAAG